MDDKAVINEVWGGRVPVCFSMAEDELFGTDPPEPYYFVLPRRSYFPLFYEKLLRHFSHFVEEGAVDQLWLEYNNQPLKWHYPIGVLFDLLEAGSSLPWKITVHFRDFPEEEVLRCEGKEAVESLFMSTLKEADALKHRGEVINNMLKKEHRQLWNGLSNDKCDQFWSINQRLMDIGTESCFKAVPLRVYEKSEGHYRQLLVRPAEEGRQQTVADVLAKLTNSAANAGDEASETEVLCHGISLNHDAPLQWLSQNMSYPDNFLHLVVSTH